tara:strand:- start:80 stop:304 length:225 start_codon:yes stop_codon:yes gene_type:complete
MIKLLWVVAFVHAQSGPTTGRIKEETIFTNEVECSAFGEAMKGRVADYARGAAGLQWKNFVAVLYKCEPNGDPA